MSFHEVRFPLRLSFGAEGGPERRTEIVSLASGFEERNSPWARSRRRYNVGFALSSLADVHEVIAFFEARHGRLYGFRFRDPSDHQSSAPGVGIGPVDKVIGSGDGIASVFALVKSYTSGGHSYGRRIEKPVAHSVVVAVDGAAAAAGEDFEVDHTTGLVTFLPGHVPAEGSTITAGFAFDVPVRFDTDHLSINVAAFEAGEIPSIPLVEIRLP